MFRTKSNKPFFSVLITCRNAADTITDMLDSIKKQTSKNYEVLIINDISTDNTLEVLEKYKSDNPDFNMTIVENTEYAGYCGARNSLMGQAKGQYLIQVDADDVIVSEKSFQFFERQLSMNQYDILFVQCVDNKDRRLLFPTITTIKNNTFFDYVNIGTWSKVVKKSFIDEHKSKLRFEDIQCHGDALYHYRLLSETNNVWVNQECVFYKYCGVHMDSIDNYAMNLEHVLMHIKESFETMYYCGKYDKQLVKRHFVNRVNNLMFRFETSKNKRMYNEQVERLKEFRKSLDEMS